MATSYKSRGLRMAAFCVLLIVIVLTGAYLGLRFGPLPVAVADSPFPFERQLVRIPLRARVNKELQTAPFGPSDEVLASGARVYREQCAFCHGLPGHDSPHAKRMYPPPPQLWKKSSTGRAVGVSEQEPGFAYWFVANGVRLTGMPSFTHTLSETQMWQVSLLLKNADKAMPAPVVEIFKAPER
jgi:mono/diheme cytochrome c family protein